MEFPALAVGDGPVVVCWHGFPDHPASFGPLAEHLVASGRRVVAPFLRGHHPAHADAMTYADGLTLATDAAVARALRAGDAEGVDMIGHDIRAGMVARAAAAWPESVRRAVTMAVPPPASMPGLFAEAQAGLATGSRVETLPGAGHFMHLDRPEEVARIVLEWLR